MSSCLLLMSRSIGGIRISIVESSSHNHQIGRLGSLPPLSLSINSLIFSLCKQAFGSAINRLLFPHSTQLSPTASLLIATVPCNQSTTPSTALIRIPALHCPEPCGPAALIFCCPAPGCLAPLLPCTSLPCTPQPRSSHPYLAPRRPAIRCP